jgi:hypothetical protein
MQGAPARQRPQATPGGKKSTKKNGSSRKESASKKQSLAATAIYIGSINSQLLHKPAAGDNYFVTRSFQPVDAIDHIDNKRQNTWPSYALKQYPAAQLEIFSDGEWHGKLGQVCKVVEVRSPYA